MSCNNVDDKVNHNSSMLEPATSPTRELRKIRNKGGVKSLSSYGSMEGIGPFDDTKESETTTTHILHYSSSPPSRPRTPVTHHRDGTDSDKGTPYSHTEFPRTRKLSKNQFLRSPSDTKRVFLGNYQLGETLGRGASGVVIKALNIQSGEFVAIKQVSKKNLSSQYLSEVKREVEILQKLHHQNIVRVSGLVESDEHLNLVFEYIENGSLTDIMKKFGPFPESIVQVYILQVLEGLNYLHQQNLLHRDIKASNILITKEGIVKLADFGLASSEQNKKEVVGSPYWLAPEVIEVMGHLPASDVWSVGITAIELLTGAPPYYDLNPMSAVFKIVENESPPMPDDASEEMLDFLRQCLEKNPQQRASANTLLQHPWIKEVKKSTRPESEGLSIRELADKLIKYNRTNNNTLRMRTLRGFNKETENSTTGDIDYEELLKEPRLDLGDLWRQSSSSSLTRSGSSGHTSASEDKNLSRKRYNSLNSKRSSVTGEVKREGFLKTTHKYWFVLSDNPPVLSYFGKKEDVLAGKPAKGQILLLGCEVERTYVVKGEPFAFFLCLPNGSNLLLCGKSNEEIEAWAKDITDCQTSISSLANVRCHEIMRKQQEHIKKLQSALQSVLNENERRLKNPTEGFYRELFCFIGLSVKKNECPPSMQVDVEALYEKALKLNVPFHQWYLWIPQQIRLNSKSK